MQALKVESVDFIVAPYEADAQMAYLALNGMVHAVSPYIHTLTSIALKHSMEGACLVHDAIVKVLSKRVSHHGLRTPPIPIRTPTTPNSAK